MEEVRISLIRDSIMKQVLAKRAKNEKEIKKRILKEDGVGEEAQSDDIKVKEEGGEGDKVDNDDVDDDDDDDDENKIYSYEEYIKNQQLSKFKGVKATATRLKDDEKE